MTETDNIGAPVAEIFELPELIDYQEDTIVSRTLVDEEAGTITVFAFGEDQRLSEHSAPHEALLQVVDGTAIITIDGEEYELAAGESIILPSDVPHAVDAVSAFKMVLTMIR